VLKSVRSGCNPSQAKHLLPLVQGPWTRLLWAPGLMDWVLPQGDLYEDSWASKRRKSLVSVSATCGPRPPVRNRWLAKSPRCQTEPIGAPAPAFVPQEDVAMEEVAETVEEMEATEPQATDLPDEVETEVSEAMEVVDEPVEAVAESITVEEEVVDHEPMMSQPSALLKPIRGVLRPLEEEESVRTASLTPVGHMLIPKKERGAPPSASVGKPKTAQLKPVRGTLKPVSKTPAKRLEPAEDDEN
jgi:hypothetical protein